MKKKIITALITLTMLFAMAVPSMAAANVSGFKFSTEQDTQINQLSEIIEKNYGIEAYLVYDTSVSGNSETIALAEKGYKDMAKGSNGVCLAITSDFYYFHLNGTAINLINDQAEDEIWQNLRSHKDSNYNYTIAYYAALNTVLAKSKTGTSSSASVPSTENETDKESTTAYYMIDDADLISDDQEQEIEAYLKGISVKQNFDVVVVTTDSVGGKTPEAYADDYFDYNGYGRGENHDGCLLLVSMEDRDWHISTTGYGITALTDAGIEYISDRFLPSLSDGDYYNAFLTFGEYVDMFVTQAKTGTPYDVSNMPEVNTERQFSLKVLLVGLGAGALIAAIVVSMQTSKLKSVRPKNEANEYLVDGSFVVTGSSDRYIRSDVVKTAKPKESSSGGSSTHSGSSGTSHGGGGGKF